MKTRLIFYFLSFLFISQSAFGQSCIPGLYSECDFCMCSQGVSPLAMGGSAIRYDARYTELNDNYSIGKYQANPTNHQEQYFTQTLSFTYGIAPDLSATLLVPFARKTETSADPSDLFGATATNGTVSN